MWPGMGLVLNTNLLGASRQVLEFPLNPHTTSAAGLEVLPDYLELPCSFTLLLIPDQNPSFLHNRWDKGGESCSSADVLIDWWGGLTAVRWLFV